MNNTKIDSPRIRKLYEDIKISKEESLQAFWSEIVENGSPIIEKAEEDENYLVTLTWREDEHIDTLAVYGEMFDMDSQETQLEKLVDTDLWYRT